METIETIIRDATARITTVVRASILSKLNGAGTRAVQEKLKPRKKAPVQLCPVPKCKKPAAPVFGMVCADHKGLSKTLIAKYREARRAKNGKAAKAKPAKAKA